MPVGTECVANAAQSYTYKGICVGGRNQMMLKPVRFGFDCYCPLVE